MDWQKLYSDVIKSIQIVKRYIFYILVIVMLAAILIMHIFNNIEQGKQVAVLKETLHEQTSLRHEIAEMKMELEDQIASGTALTVSLLDSSANTNTHRTVYTDSQKKSYEGLYTEAMLIEKEQDGARLFRDGEYALASVQYAVVAEMQPENTGARFYYLYSLFLSNKLDRGNYRKIKEGLEVLERDGYFRPQIREVLAHIEMEESGLEIGAFR